MRFSELKMSEPWFLFKDSLYLKKPTESPGEANAIKYPEGYAKHLNESAMVKEVSHELARRELQHIHKEDGNSEVWRYMTLPKYIAMLQSKAIYCARIDCFDDKTEGHWCTAIAPHLIADDATLNYERGQSKVIKIIRQYTKEKKSAESILETIKKEEAGFDFLLFLNSMENIRAKGQETIEEIKNISSLVSSIGKEELKNKYGPLLEYAIDPEGMRIKSEEKRKKTYASCWCSGVYQSAALWEIFSLGENGVAIKTTKEKLKKLTNAISISDVKTGCFDIHYVNEATKALAHMFKIGVELEPFFPVMFKGTAYSYESEYRLAVLKDNADNEYGYLVPIDDDLNELIEAVYVHPSVGKNHWFYKVVDSVNSKYGIEAGKLKINSTEV